MASRAKAQISHVIMSNANSAKFGKDNLDEYMLDCVTKGAASSPSPPPRPYLPVPACVCPRVPTPTSLPMPSCARCYHTDKWSLRVAQGLDLLGPPLPSNYPNNRHMGSTVPLMLKSSQLAPSQQPSQQPSVQPSQQQPSEHPPPEQQPSEQQPPEQQPSEQQPSLQQPSEQQPSEQCQPASPAVKEVCSAYRYHTQYHTTRRHHTPQLATLTILTTLTALATLTVLRTHHSRTHCTCHTRRMLSILIILQFSPFSPFSSGGRQDGAADALGL